jgi:hypothetical protein
VLFAAPRRLAAIGGEGGESAADPCMRSCLCFVRKTSDSVHGDWRNSRAGCSTNLERCHDKCEFLHSLAQEFVELEVLKKMHSTHHQPELRHDRVPYARRGTHEVQAAIFGSISRSICTRRHVRFFEQAFDLFAGRRAEPQKISNDEIRQIEQNAPLGLSMAPRSIPNHDMGAPMEQRFPYEQSEWAGGIDAERRRRWYEALEKMAAVNVRARLAQTDAGSLGTMTIGSESITIGFVQEWLAWHDRQTSERENSFRRRQIFWTRWAAWAATVAALATAVGWILTTWRQVR